MRRQRHEERTPKRALEHILANLDGLDAELATIDHELAELATRQPCADPLRWPSTFRGIGIRTALGV